MKPAKSSLDIRLTTRPVIMLRSERGYHEIISRCCRALRRAGWPYERIEAFGEDARDCGDVDALIVCCRKYCDLII